MDTLNKRPAEIREAIKNYAIYRELGRVAANVLYVRLNPRLGGGNFRGNYMDSHEFTERLENFFHTHGNNLYALSLSELVIGGRNGFLDLLEKEQTAQKSERVKKLTNDFIASIFKARIKAHNLYLELKPDEYAGGDIKYSKTFFEFLEIYCLGKMQKNSCFSYCGEPLVEYIEKFLNYLTGGKKNG